MASRHVNYHAMTSFYDILFQMLCGFIILFIMTLMMVNEEKTKKHDGLETKAEFVVVVTWPAEFADDVDTYVVDPEDRIVFFNRREDGLMHLDRDDLGHRNDTVETIGGIVKFSENREAVAIRGIIPGQYIVNVHLFHREGIKPIPVTIKLEKINPYSVVITKTVILELRGDEKTAFRFTINKDGRVSDINYLSRRLIGKE